MTKNVRRFGFACALFVMACQVSPSAGARQAPTPDEGPKATTIRGVVTAEAGRPVPGAAVRAHRESVGGSGRSFSFATTSADGSFEVDALEPGRYSVSVDAPPYIVVDGLFAGSAEPGSSLAIRMAKGGVITGRVSDATGDPVTGLVVVAWHETDKRIPTPASARYGQHGGLTDDRGVYRLWGLSAGVYVVAATGAAEDYEMPQYLSDRPPTFHPSSNRAGAAAVKVGLGDEVTGIDIVFRNEPGFRVSGTVEMFPQFPYGVGATVELFPVGSARPERQVETDGGSRRLAFGFNAVENGEYELRARCSPDDDSSPWISERVPVKVNGESVTRIRLELQPTSEIRGRVEWSALPPPSECVDVAGEKSRPALSEVVTVRLFRVDAATSVASWEKPDGDGRFVADGLEGTRYRIWLEFRDPALYAERSDVFEDAPDTGAARVDRTLKVKQQIPAGQSSTARPSASFASDGLTLKRGQRVSGVHLVVARGAASMRGRIAPAKAGESLPSRARVVLVPADAKRKDDVIHFYEVIMERDGSFDVRNVAPGEYFVATRVLPDDDRPDPEIMPAAWDTKERAALRASAEKAGIRVTLSPCQRLESAVVTIHQNPER